ncbi:MAG: ATP-binding domain-containing protein, partial [Geminicoccaceae bacterium]|nr:ATP-binding domain-containing protein [Geminicoccaceae bacterium]
VMDTVGDPDADMVTIMTLHGAKGLEFANVFLAGWEEGLFPNQRSLDEGGSTALEEERRLAYVGITRARQRCTISFAANRQVYNQWSTSTPSRFVEELPAEHVEHLHRNPAMRPDREALFDDAMFEPQVARYRSRKAALAKVIDGRAETLSVRPAVKSGRFKVGDRIFHDKFGYGQVEAIEGNKLEIAFEKAGSKKVIDSFVQAA